MPNAVTENPAKPESDTADAIESFAPVAVTELPKSIGRPAEISEADRGVAASIMSVIGPEYANAARSSAVLPDQKAATTAGRKRVRLMTRVLGEQLPEGQQFKQQALPVEGGFTYAVRVGPSPKPRAKKSATEAAPAN